MNPPMVPHTPADEFYDLIRLFVIVLSLYCLVQIGLLYHWWVHQPMYLRFILLSNLIFVVVSGYGVVESYVLDVPGGPRSLGFLVSIIYCAVGLTLGVRAIDRKPPKE